ncbi:ABC-type Fe3+ transport system, permease component [Acidovorax sp. CF316]|uniref:ABC transporter permease n=1 Tax=Acidovorax sp. CF316 TaxID=1144317 RepID=UPI00026BC3B5|nr:iron ABC transporter permease [Acidovorax sp. CF316]EJE50768.1 ABC-type Fe3+ transport system, permease component [Acidovorax sp. CF316]
MSAVYSEPGAAGPGAARPRRLLHALTGVGPWLAFGLILAFLALFLLIPVGLVVYTAFINETGALTIGHFANFFAQSVFRESFFNSLVVSLASVFFASLIAVPLAYLTVRFEFRGALLIQTLGVLPLIMPPFVGAVALQLIFGRNGSVNLLLNEYLGFTVPIMDGLVGVTFVESIHYFPFILLNLVASMRNIDGAMEESALNLGARGWRLFRRVIFPLAMPGYLAGAALVFVKVFDDLGTPLVMGVTNMLAPQAYLRITSVGIDDPLGYVISVIMIAFSILALWMAARVMKGKDYATLQKGGSSLQRRRLSAWESVLAYGWIGLILLVTLAPHIGILLMSFSKVWSFSVLPDAYTLEHYATVFTDSKQMIGNTLLYCFIAAGLDVVIGTAIAYLILRTQLPARRWLDYLASAALAIPGLVLAIGYLRMFKGVNLPFTDTPVVTTWVLIMLAYAVRRLPYALRSCMAALQQVHVSLEEAAQSLGASRLSTIRRIMVPLMMGGILAGFVTSFITAAVELSATILLASAQSQAPISYGIYLYMQSISGRGPGAALGVLAVVVVGLGTYFSHRFVERSRTTVQAKQG